MGEQKNVLNVNIKKANKMKTEKNTFLEKVSQTANLFDPP